jgi:hypothetical protein
MQGVGSINHEDMMYGLRQLNFSPPIHLSFDDYQSMVREHGEASDIVNRDGRMDVHGFEVLIYEQLKHYVQRRTSQAMQGAAASGSSIGHVLFVLKLLSANIENVSATLDRLDHRVDKLEAITCGDQDAGRESGNSFFNLGGSASSAYDDATFRSPLLPGAASTSAKSLLPDGRTHAPVDISLHCKVDKLTLMVENLASAVSGVHRKPFSQDGARGAARSPALRMRREAKRQQESPAASVSFSTDAQKTHPEVRGKYAGKANMDIEEASTRRESIRQHQEAAAAVSSLADSRNGPPGEPGM